MNLYALGLTVASIVSTILDGIGRFLLIIDVLLWLCKPWGKRLSCRAVAERRRKSRERWAYWWAFFWTEEVEVVRTRTSSKRKKRKIEVFVNDVEL